VWEAEAIEDGRLVDADRASYERHAAGCAECKRELAALADVRATMMAAPEPARTPLQRRAERAAILRRANGDYVHAGAPRAFGRLAFALAVPLLVVLFVVGRGALGRKRLEVSLGQAAGWGAPTPSFEVVDARGAQWSSAIEGHVARVSLRAGVASFHVEHVAPGKRFLLALPDGELEVHGTRFLVDVQAGATRSVEVTEGLVALRLGGAPQRFLRAGEHWSADGTTSATSAAPLGTVATPAPPPRNDATAAGGTSAPLTGTTPGTTPGRTGGTASAANASASVRPALSASDRYAEAIGAYRVGAYAKADALFAAFVRDFPGDPSCEDASFLRAVCHQRIGDSAGAASLARAYLARYPSGLRRPEAERIAAPTAD
jgi:ferric-dicitrate binding protein FerR (iron transport regulator)